MKEDKFNLCDKEGNLKEIPKLNINYGGRANRKYIDIIIEYLQKGKAKRVDIIGHSETKTTFHNINKETKEKYLIHVFKCDIVNLERPIDIYNKDIKKRIL